MKIAYLDSSAAVKLVVAEAETNALRLWLRGRVLTSSALLRVEVVRAVRPDGVVVVERAMRFMRRFELFRIGRLVLDRAASLEPLRLRTLDAIHLASAMLVMEPGAYFVSYDKRLCDAADQLGLQIASPSGPRPKG